MYLKFIKVNFPFSKGEGKRRKLSFPSTVVNFRDTFRSQRYSFIASYDAKNELKMEHQSGAYFRGKTKHNVQKRSPPTPNKEYPVRNVTLKYQRKMCMSKHWILLFFRSRAYQYAQFVTFSMRRLTATLLSPGWDVSSSQGHLKLSNKKWRSGSSQSSLSSCPKHVTLYCMYMYNFLECPKKLVRNVGLCNISLEM